MSTEEVGRYLHIAPSTARKLLASMEEQGLLIRTYGGAISVDKNKDVALSQKMMTNMDRKKRIAACARKFVKDGDRIAVAGGSTLLEFCTKLHDLKYSTVFTDSLMAANVLITNHNIEVLTKIVDVPAHHKYWLFQIPERELQENPSILPEDQNEL